MLRKVNSMNSLVADTLGGKGLRRLDSIPAPEPCLGLLSLLRRPVPLRELRPAAIASGMSMEVIETAIGIATRRGELRIEADRDGTILAVRCRP
jgi:hypothetical protein